MIRKRTTSVIIAASLLLAGCGVSYDSALLASIEGRWMCDVQRFTFDDVGDIQAELDARLAGNAVTAEQYRAFKDDLTDQPDLRAEVAVEFAEYCDTGS
jgi:major membrane immunogen (membrane-anchored lipoprotein)